MGVLLAVPESYSSRESAASQCRRLTSWQTV